MYVGVFWCVTVDDEVRFLYLIWCNLYNYCARFVVKCNFVVIGKVVLL